MRFARCSDGGRVFWALVNTERETVCEIQGSFSSWAPGFTRSRDVDDLEINRREIPLADLRLLPPVEKTQKIEVVGGNYSQHLTEIKLKGADQPVVFLKAYGALIGASDPIRYPPLTEQLDYEVELVVVVGSDSLDRDDPLSGVLGYTVGNDISARDLQMRGPRDISMDLFGAKSQDKTCGVGPWIVTTDEFQDGHPTLDMRLSVNGEVRQNGNTGEMTWTVAELLVFSDQRSTLEAGDIIFTGTPTGVGLGSGQFLKRGDIVEAEIDGVGVLRNRVE